jgi:hypothetical protein
MAYLNNYVQVFLDGESVPFSSVSISPEKKRPGCVIPVREIVLYLPNGDKIVDDGSRVEVVVHY